LRIPPVGGSSGDHGGHGHVGGSGGLPIVDTLKATTIYMILTISSERVYKYYIIARPVFNVKIQIH